MVFATKFKLTLIFKTKPKLLVRSLNKKLQFLPFLIKLSNLTVQMRSKNLHAYFLMITRKSKPCTFSISEEVGN